MCEGEISRAIEGKVEEQKRLLTFKVNANIDLQEVMNYLQEQGFTVNVCLTTILKVVAVVDVLVPSYGYTPIPPCTPYTGDEVCPGVFDLPLYPTAVSPQSNNAR